LHSGAVYREGLNPYAFFPLVQPHPISPEALNLNPPISVYPFAALTFFDADIIRFAFLAGSLVMYAAAVGLLMRAYPDKRGWQYVLAIVSLAGLWHMVYYLQVYAPLLLAVVGAWLLMRRGSYVWAGILIGIVIAIKP